VRRPTVSERTPPTSRRKKAKAAPEPAAAPEPGRGPELLRRALLGLATALIAVRALVPGEDVGLFEPNAHALGLAVPLLWLCGLVSWAAWRIWSRQLAWYGGLVEAGLLVVVLFSFFGTATVATYQHPAWVVSWEWAGLLAGFFLVRQIARSAADQQGLLAALLACGVCLAAQSLWQHVLPDRGQTPVPGLTAEDLPRLRGEMLAVFGSTPEAPLPANLGRAALARGTFLGNLSLAALAVLTSDRDPTLFERIAAHENVALESGRPVLPSGLRPTPPQPPTATFQSASNLAGLLALLLPALAGCVLAAWLGGAPRWQLGVAVGATALVGLALALTGVRSAVLPCLLVGAAAAALAWRYSSARLSPRVLLLLVLGGPAVLLALAFALGPGQGQGFDALAREWSTASAIIRDHFGQGVGAGNYVRYYPQYMAPAAPAVASQPSNFILEVWATLGLPALLALGVALASFFRRTLVLVPRTTAGEEPLSATEPQPTRWEFYEGGMVGLLVGFVLRTLPLPMQAIPAEAIAAVARAVVWFAAFALLQGVRWGGATRVLACTAGVAVLLLHLAVSGGISVPGVAQPMWLLMALALNGLPERSLPVGRHLLWRVLPLVLTAAAALMCGLQAFVPLNSASADDRLAMAMGQRYLDLRAGVTRSQPDGTTERLADPVQHLRTINERLQSAVSDNPGNARLWTDLANWYGELYLRLPNEDYRQNGLRCARMAQFLDARGQEGYLAEYRLHAFGAARAPKPEVRGRAANEGPRPLLRAMQFWPRDSALHYHCAVALFGANDNKLSKLYANLALELDSAAPTPERRLTEAQRQQARRIAADSDAR
jgi:hypothetical protein